jgi:hypothetical protein
VQVVPVAFYVGGTEKRQELRSRPESERERERELAFIMCRPLHVDRSGGFCMRGLGIWRGACWKKDCREGCVGWDKL